MDEFLALTAAPGSVLPPICANRATGRCPCIAVEFKVFPFRKAMKARPNSGFNVVSGLPSTINLQLSTRSPVP